MLGETSNHCHCKIKMDIRYQLINAKRVVAYKMIDCNWAEMSYIQEHWDYHSYGLFEFTLKNVKSLTAFQVNNATKVALCIRSSFTFFHICRLYNDFNTLWC